MVGPGVVWATLHACFCGRELQANHRMISRPQYCGASHAAALPQCHTLATLKTVEQSALLFGNAKIFMVYIHCRGRAEHRYRIASSSSSSSSFDGCEIQLLVGLVGMLLASRPVNVIDGHADGLRPTFERLQSLARVSSWSSVLMWRPTTWTPQPNGVHFVSLLPPSSPLP